MTLPVCSAVIPPEGSAIRNFAFLLTCASALSFAVSAAMFALAGLFGLGAAVSVAARRKRG